MGFKRKRDCTDGYSNKYLRRYTGLLVRTARGTLRMKTVLRPIQVLGLTYFPGMSLVICAGHRGHREKGMRLPDRPAVVQICPPLKFCQASLYQKTTIRDRTVTTPIFEPVSLCDVGPPRQKISTRFSRYGYLSSGTADNVSIVGQMTPYFKQERDRLPHLNFNNKYPKILTE